MLKRVKPSSLLFAALCGLLAAIKLLFDFYPGEFPVKEQAAAFTWLLIGGVCAVALAGLFASRAAGLPDPLAEPKRDVRGLQWASGLAILYGVWTIFSYLQDPGAWTQMALPWSIPFYAFGGILLEFMLRLGALCVSFWLVHVLILRRRLRLTTFWILAAIVGLYEILPYVMDDFNAGHWGAVALGLLSPLYWTHLVEAGLLYRFGWLAPIVFRLVDYVVWHLAFGGFYPPPA